MRINGYPTEWNEEEGLLPIELQDVVFSANAEELRKLAAFFKEIASEAESPKEVRQSIVFGDSKPNPKKVIRIIAISQK